MSKQEQEPEVSREDWAKAMGEVTDEAIKGFKFEFAPDMTVAQFKEYVRDEHRAATNDAMSAQLRANIWAHIRLTADRIKDET